MMTMKAAHLAAPGQIELLEVERPVPRGGDVLIRVEAALTCGTDLKAYARGHHLIPMPGPFGHEYAGVVEAVGPKVRRFAPGDPVMGVHSAPCGTCYWCGRGEGNLCPHVMERKVLGAYAQYLLIPEHIARVNLFHKPEHLSFAEAALLEPLSCVVHGLEQVPVSCDDTVLIVGPGAIGLLHLAVLRARGCRRVFVAGRSAYRLERARAMGAAATFDVRAVDLRRSVLDATAGRGADLVIECTGQQSVWEEAIWLCRRGGRVVLFGGLPGGRAVRFDAARLHYDQITLHSPFHFTPAAVQAARELLCRGLEGVHHLITDSIPLDRIGEAFARLERGEGLKCAILPWDGKQARQEAQVL